MGAPSAPHDVALYQLLAVNTIDMYSSGVTLQALGLPIRRWGAVIIDTVVCAVVTGLILFHGELQQGLRRVPAVHRGVAGAVVRHLDDRLRAARPEV
jgi:hypothetical protein